MSTITDDSLHVVENHARRQAATLACELFRARSADSEVLLCALECEKWLADSCRQCQ